MRFQTSCSSLVPIVETESTKECGHAPILRGVAVHSFRLWKLKVIHLQTRMTFSAGCSSLVPIVETESFNTSILIIVPSLLQFTRSDCGN